MVASQTCNLKPRLCAALPIEQTAKELCAIADEEITKAGVVSPSKFLRQWMYCESICAFVLSKVAFDAALVEKTLGKGEVLEIERWRRQAVKVVYGLEKPLATCDGFCRITEALARLSGIKCWHLDGTMRADGHRPTATNHGWVMFELDGGIRIPSDTTAPWGGRRDLSKMRTKVGWRTMPCTVRNWEAILGLYYQNSVIVDETKEFPGSPTLCNIDYNAWLAFDIRAYDRLGTWYDNNTNPIVRD